MARGLAGKVFILVAAVCVSSLRLTPHPPADQPRLAAILKKSEDYCRRLDGAALDFVCLEEVTEMSRYFSPHTDVYLYDYQFIRKNRAAQEKRSLLAVNGKKADIRDSTLKTTMFRYENVFFGPIGLLSESWQAYLDYRIVGEEILNKEKAVVIEAMPGPRLNEPHPWGRVWIKEDDGSVLKIVWDQKSLGNFQSFEEWAKAHNAVPQVTAFSEYDFEKNGLRFPSRNFSEQAYVDEDGQKFVNAQISVIYKNYKYFTVETEIKYE
ncbi:MAG: hypothetical protein MUQ00_00770 [Candidatus Aminicenantes bacterium]|nr:hypothetical protein [Candidatus Aminicenantes bacterium]